MDQHDRIDITAATYLAAERRARLERALALRSLVSRIFGARRPVHIPAE